MTIADLIIKVATNALKHQRKDGSLLGGNNGPYHDSETSVRNTGHWLITFSRCYKITKDRRYLKAVEKAANYLTSNKARPKDFSFYHRSSRKKDRCNGLIGQAWTIEALVIASKMLKDDKYRNLARDVVLQHKFDSEYGLWHRLDINGQILSIDMAFNHQLWFATCSSLIGNKKINSKVNRFMDSIDRNMTLLKDGLIYHVIEKDIKHRISIYKQIRNTIKGFIYKKDRKDRVNTSEKEMLYRSFGYQLFNMYAFALLKHSVPDHKLWKSNFLIDTFNYICKTEFRKKIRKNKYAYGYNAPGFEYPYILYYLGDGSEVNYIKTCTYWINKQLEITFNKKTVKFDRNNEDPLTLTARIYELTRLPVSILMKIEVNF